jgi:hypothetical protein
LDWSAEIVNSRDSLTMGYFDKLYNEFLNKYKKNFKNEKTFMDVFFYF